MPLKAQGCVRYKKSVKVEPKDKEKGSDPLPPLSPSSPSRCFLFDYFLCGSGGKESVSKPVQLRKLKRLLFPLAPLPKKEKEMGYCTKEDIYPGQITEAVILQITDDTRAKTVIDGVIEAIVDTEIENATAFIDGYAKKGYVIPLTPVPMLIKKFCVDVAIYNLYGRRDLDPPAERTRRYKEVVRFLEMLNEGLVTIGAETPASTSSPGQVDFSSATPMFKREDLEEF